MNEDVDAPITDIAFLTSTENCPSGYRVIEVCPCGHSAQLWENIRGDKEEDRYIAYTKEYKDGMVVEEMLINDNTMRYLRPGYEVLQRTHDGSSSRLLRHRDVILKKVKRSEAERAVMDVTLYRKSDKPSSLYTKIGKSNGISICTRVAPLMDKYRHMSAATASASRAVKYETQDLEGGLAQHKRQPPQELQDIRSRAFTAPAMDHYTGPTPGHPTPPVGAGATFTQLHPYSTPPPAFPTYPSVGFNTSAPDLPTPYPMYPPPGNQAGYTQGYPPQVGYPPVHPPQGQFPTSTEPLATGVNPHGLPQHTAPNSYYGFNV